ncbi:MotA/TolQ/ExbB proton channel family protein [bacterium]|nr:MotA/TolQ/ExbB proton channel family protein [bacterium]
MILLIGGIEWFTKGGWAMYPLLALSIYSLYVILNRAFFFAQYVRRVDGDLENVLRGTSLLPERLEGVLGPLLARGLRERRLDDKRAQLAAEHELLEGARWLNSLETVFLVAPMLGLTGTVTGMVRTFQQVAHLKGQVNPSVLAGGIWEALLTTAFGLVVAIPALIAYRYFRSRLLRWENHLRTVVDDALQMDSSTEGGGE